MSADLVAAKLRRAGYVLLAGFCALVSTGFLTAGGWLFLSESYGAGPASVITGSVYIVLALLILLLRPREVDRGPDKVSVGLALGASFLQGFTAGQQVRR